MSKKIIIFLLFTLAACAAPKECCSQNKDIICNNGKD